MAMAYIWAGMVVISILYGGLTGQGAAVGMAAMDGAREAFALCFAIGGMLCLWSGVMEVMRRSGMAAGLARLLRPVLCGLFPSAAKDADTMEALSQNVSANVLGLGNAATPAGIRAAKGLLRLHGGGTASDELCRLVVLNTASIQLLPTTVAAVRAAAGARNAFDILPMVWLSSIAAVAAGLAAATLFQRLTK